MRDVAGLVVALETSGAVGSVAVAREGHVLARRFLEGASTHASRLIPALGELLEGAGMDRDDLRGVVVGAGPGSFTGVRVAAATAKGLVHALDLPLWAVSSLEAAAVAGWALEGVEGPWGSRPEAGPGDRPSGRSSPDGGTAEAVRYVLFDARGGRVYAACYRVVDSGLDVVRPPRATHLDAVLEEPPGPEVHFVGDGALRHRKRIVARGGVVRPAPAGVPTADGLVRVLALRRGQQPVADPWRWEPDYLRPSGAERARTP